MPTMTSSAGMEPTPTITDLSLNLTECHMSLLEQVVAPHGLFGQTFDGDDIAVSGATDDLDQRDSREPSSPSEVTTAAQGEGAIEGTIDDYVLTDRWSTQFKYSRFDATAARPRDASKLAGRKTKRSHGKSGTQNTGVEQPPIVSANAQESDAEALARA